MFYQCDGSDGWSTTLSSDTCGPALHPLANMSSSIDDPAARAAFDDTSSVLGEYIRLHVDNIRGWGNSSLSTSSSSASSSSSLSSLSSSSTRPPPGGATVEAPVRDAHLLSIGHNSLHSLLPSNSRLDFVTHHTYPTWLSGNQSATFASQSNVTDISGTFDKLALLWSSTTNTATTATSSSGGVGSNGSSEGGTTAIAAAAAAGGSFRQHPTPTRPLLFGEFGTVSTAGLWEFYVPPLPLTPPATTAVATSSDGNRDAIAMTTTNADTTSSSSTTSTNDPDGSGSGRGDDSCTLSAGCVDSLAVTCAWCVHECESYVFTMRRHTADVA